MKKPAVILATALSTVALAGLVGIGVASADPTPSPASPTASSTATPSAGATPRTPATKPGKAGKAGKAGQKAGQPGKRDLARRALHGEVALGGKKPKVVAFQRGTVTAVSSTSLTVKSADDFSATYVVDGSTKVREKKEKTDIGAVKTGDKVRVVAVEDGSTVTATRIADRTA